jgi:hypothetical protein
MTHRRQALLLAIVASASAAIAPAPASGDVYRCTRPDGGIVFTDNESACPGSAKHEPADKVQSFPREDDPVPAAPGREARDAYARQIEEERAQKTHWQQRKRMKEEELRVLEQRHRQLGEFVTACNRGMEIISRDASGMKYQVPCDRVRKEYEETRALQEPLREYLETGLARECRRAGCLPGWIR